MGGSSRFSKKVSPSPAPPPLSLLSFLKPTRRPARRRDEVVAEDVSSLSKVRPSDYDKGRYVAEPGIDRRATAFIARFHENQAIAV